MNIKDLFKSTLGEFKSMKIDMSKADITIEPDCFCVKNKNKKTIELETKNEEVKLIEEEIVDKEKSEKPVHNKRKPKSQTIKNKES